MESHPSRPVHPGLFRESDRSELIGGRCTSCGQHHFPFLTTCPYCSSADTREAALSNRGKLWAWTAVTAAPPGYKGDVPFGFGVVELAGAVRVITRITESDPARLTFGQEMQLQVVPLHVDDKGETVTTWAFSPEHSSRRSPAEP